MLSSFVGRAGDGTGTHDPSLYEKTRVFCTALEQSSLAKILSRGLGKG